MENKSNEYPGVIGFIASREDYERVSDILIGMYAFAGLPNDLTKPSAAIKWLEARCKANALLSAPVKLCEVTFETSGEDFQVSITNPGDIAQCVLAKGKITDSDELLNAIVMVIRRDRQDVLNQITEVLQK